MNPAIQATIFFTLFSSTIFSLSGGLSLRMGRTRNHVSAPTQVGVVGNDNNIDNVRFGGIGYPTQAPIPDFLRFYVNGMIIHPYTRRPLVICPKVPEDIQTMTGGRCPRGWAGEAECKMNDVSHLTKCAWKTDVEIKLPKRTEEFNGVICTRGRMSCMGQMGVIPGQTEVIHVPKNSLFDPNELEVILSHTKMLKVINLSRNDFIKLGWKTFRSNRYLRSVNFDLNYLLDIPEFIFARNPLLSSASFIGNKLDYLPARLFYVNYYLTVVDFQRNNITLIPPEVFHQNHRLEVVRLSGNSIFDLPSGIFSENPKLIEIRLGGNRISVIPKSLFANNQNLRTVNMGGNKIRKLPATLFDNCRELRTVTLERNMITSLPAGLFAKNKNLAHLDLSYNKIRVIRPGLMNNPLLIVVNLPWTTHPAMFEDHENEDGTWTSDNPRVVRKFNLRLNK